MAIDRSEILVRAGFDNTALASGLRDAESMVGSWASKMQSAAGKIFSFAAPIGMIALFERALDKVKEIYAASEKTGLNTTQFQQLSAIANNELPAGAEKFEEAITRLNVKIGEGDKLLDKWSIHSQDAANAIYEIADKMKDISDPAARAALAFDLFGKSGADLIPLLEQGAASLKEMSSNTSVFTDQDMVNIRKVHQEMDQIEDTVTLWAGKFLGIIYDGVAHIRTYWGNSKLFGGRGQQFDADTMRGALKKFQEWQREQAAFVGTGSFGYGSESVASEPDKNLDELDKLNQEKLEKQLIPLSRIREHMETIAEYKKEIAALDERSLDYVKNYNELQLKILDEEDKVTASKKAQQDLDNQSSSLTRRITTIKNEIDDRVGGYSNISTIAKDRHSPFAATANNLLSAQKQLEIDRRDVPQGGMDWSSGLRNFHRSRADILSADSAKIKNFSDQLSSVPGLLSPQATFQSLNKTLDALNKQLEGVNKRGGKADPMYVEIGSQ